MKITLSWKVLVENPKSDIRYSENSKLFNRRTGNTFLNKIGGAKSLNFLPTILEPTNVFYNALENSKQTNEFIGKKFPFNFKDIKSENKPYKINITIHRYHNNITLLTVSLNSFIHNTDVSELIKIQKLESYPSINRLIKTICGIILSDGKEKKEVSYSPKSYPSITIENINPNDIISEHNLVKILTGHNDFSSDKAKIVIQKNDDHQSDSNGILIDKQGICVRHIASSNSYKEAKRKFESTYRLFEVAIIISRLLESKNLNYLNKNELESISNLINKPNIVFTKSVTAYKTWLLLIEEFKLDLLYSDYTQLEKEKNTLNIVADKKGWSELKKWTMGILASMILILFGVFISNINIADNKKIKLISPVDGKKLKQKNKKVTFSWNHIEDTKKYILLIKKYSKKKNQYVSLSNGGRYIIFINEVSISINQLGNFQWKIIAKDKKDEEIAKSSWYFFRLIKNENLTKPRSQ